MSNKSFTCFIRRIFNTSELEFDSVLKSEDNPVYLLTLMHSIKHQRRSRHYWAIEGQQKLAKPKRLTREILNMTAAPSTARLCHLTAWVNLGFVKTQFSGHLTAWVNLVFVKTSV